MSKNTNWWISLCVTTFPSMAPILHTLPLNPLWTQTWQSDWWKEGVLTVSSLLQVHAFKKLFVCMYACTCVHVHTTQHTAHIQEIRGQPWVSILSFRHVSPWDLTRVIRLAWWGFLQSEPFLFIENYLRKHPSRTKETFKEIGKIEAGFLKL